MASWIYLKSPLPSFATVKIYLYCWGLAVCANAVTLNRKNARPMEKHFITIAVYFEKPSLKIHQYNQPLAQTKVEIKEKNAVLSRTFLHLCKCHFALALS